MRLEILFSQKYKSKACREIYLQFQFAPIEGRCSSTLSISRWNKEMEVLLKNMCCETQYQHWTVCKKLSVDITSNLKTSRHCINVVNNASRILGFNKIPFFIKNKRCSTITIQYLQYALQFRSPYHVKDTVNRVFKVGEKKHYLYIAQQSS